MWYVLARFGGVWECFGTFCEVMVRFGTFYDVFKGVLGRFVKFWVVWGCFGFLGGKFWDQKLPKIAKSSQK